MSAPTIATPAVYVLLALEGKSVNEIAELTGATPTTVKCKVSRERTERGKAIPRFPKSVKVERDVTARFASWDGKSRDVPDVFDTVGEEAQMRFFELYPEWMGRV